MDIRVWLCSTTQNNYLEMLKDRKAKVNDLVVVYNPAVSNMIEIGGYRRNKTLNLPHQLTQPLSAENIEDNAEINQILTSNSTSRLTQDSWTFLKTVIIETNPDLDDVIAELEALQNPVPKLQYNSALLFELIWNAVQIFRMKQSKAQSKQMIDISDSDVFQASREKIILSVDDNTDFDTIVDQTLNTLEESGLLSTPNDNDPNLQYMRELTSSDNQNAIQGDGNTTSFSYKPPRLREENVIQRDMASDEDDMEMDSDSLIEYRTLIKKVIDPDGREIYVLLTHRRGQRNADVLGSDFVYLSAIHRSFVFLQYKMFDEKNKATFSGDNGKQLNDILEACEEFESCQNQTNSGGNPINSLDMRLGVCSFFYKFCDNMPQLPANRNTISGLHLPACLISQLCSEVGSPLEKSVDLSRYLTNSAFVDLTKKGLIGTSRSSFDRIAKAIRDATRDDLVLIAIEVQSGQILTT